MTTPSRYLDRTVVATPDQLAKLLRDATQKGRLVAVTAPHPMPGNDPRVCVRIRLRVADVAVRQPTPQRRPVRKSRHLHTRVVLPLAGLAVGALVAIGWLAVLAVQAILANLPLILGVLVVLAALALVTGNRTGSGWHCPGCRRH